MAKVYGTIESLKSLKAELEDKGISRFSSVREINDFLSDYNSEKLAIFSAEEEELEKEYFQTCVKLNKSIEEKAEIINIESVKVDNKIFALQAKIDSIQDKRKDSFLKNLIPNFRLAFLKKQSNYFRENKTKMINSSVNDISKRIIVDENFIERYKTEKQKIIEERVKTKIEKLEYIRSVLQKSRNLISGAIGENLVVKEIKKLSDDYILINDFNLSFLEPIYYKKQNQLINSIQVDHLLISKAGIFIIETKNWSKSSVNSISLRSPIEQIERSNFALYKYFSENIYLNEHHWGEQKIPVRNLIVMINNKPQAKFKFVSVKLLRELNDYLMYFEPVLTENQLNNIVDELT